MPSVWIDLDGYRRYSNARSLQEHESVFVGLDRLDRKGDSLFSDVVGVAVTRDETAEDDLSHTVEHPGGSTTLRAVGKIERSAASRDAQKK